MPSHDDILFTVGLSKLVCLSNTQQYADCLQDGSVNLVCRREVQLLLIRVINETFDPLFCLEVRKHTHIRLWKVEIKVMG